MSVLLPKADITREIIKVGFGPTTDVTAPVAPQATE
jgi:hypothetical protein